MTNLRSLYAATWMGLQHDLAWTTPALSLALRAVAPFASAITVSIIYWSGSTAGGTNFSTFDPQRLAFVLVGSTLYAHVASYAWVPTVAIAEGKNLAVFPHIYLTARSTAVYVAGLLMVFSGALFPPTILPWPVSAGATYLPFTQFIAAARVAIVPGLPGDYLYSLLLCIVGGFLLLAVSLWVYLLAEKKARKDGAIDRRLA